MYGGNTLARLGCGRVCVDGVLVPLLLFEIFSAFRFDVADFLRFFVEGFDTIGLLGR